MATELNGSAESGAQMGSGMVRFDFACKKCEKTFTAWSDDARICAYCGSRKVFKVFLTPPAQSTGRAARIEKLAERQLDAAGLSNYTNVGGTPRRTRRTDPKALEALAVAKAHNIQIPPTGPQSGLDANVQRMREQYRSLGAGGLIKSFGGHGKTQITTTPRGPGALVDSIVKRGRQIAPLASMGPRIFHPEAKEDSAKLKSMLRK